MYMYIYYNIAARGLTDIYARLPRVSAPEGEYIYISQISSKLCYNIYISLCKGLTHEKDEGFPSSNGNCSKLLR